MSKKNRASLAIVGCAIIQVGILVGMLVMQNYPLWYGTPLRLKMRPVDPRSLFSGNYAALSYEIGSLDAKLFEDSGKGLRYGEVVYVSLEREGDTVKPARVSRTKPTEDIFLRGRVERGWGGRNIQVKYGIEAYFAPVERALQIERDVRANPRLATAEIMVAPNGKAALVEIDLG